MERLTPVSVQQHAADDLIRYAACLYATRGTISAAVDLFHQRWPRAVHKDLVTRAAIAPGNTSDPSWAAPLVPALAATFAPLLYGASAFGKIAARDVPFLAQVPKQTGVASLTWVGEAKPKPIRKLAFASATPLAMLKGAVPLVVTSELLKLSSPGTEGVIREYLISEVAYGIDVAFLDPANAGIANVKPPSITNGVSATTGTAGDPAATVAAIVKAFWTAAPGATRPTLIMSAGSASALAGTGKHEKIDTVSGGFAHGMAVVLSTAAGANVVVVDAARILRAEGPIAIDLTREALVEMSDTPADPVTASTILVSLWQQNLAALRAEATMNWRALDSVQWGVLQ